MNARKTPPLRISSTAIAALGYPPTLTSSTFRVRVKSRDARLAGSCVFRKLPREATCHRWRVTLRLELQLLPISYGFCSHRMGLLGIEWK